MIVVDASVLTNAFTDDGPVGTAARAQLARDPHWAAPEHLLVESFSAVRGRWLGRRIGDARALDALEAISSAAVELVSVRPLLDRMWELRDDVSGYDAAYVALAEAYECPLVTADVRVERVPHLCCEVRVAAPASD